MRAVLAGCLGLAAVLLLVAKPDLAAAATIQSRWQDLVLREVKDCDLAGLRALVHDREFKKLTSAQRSLAQIAIGFCSKGDLLEPARLATAEPDAPSFVWSVRFMSELAHDNYSLAVDSLETAAERVHDGAFSAPDDDYIYFAVRRVRDDSALYRRFLAALDKLDWRPSSPFASAEGLRLDYASLLLDAGDVAAARLVADKLKTTRVVVEMVLDKRFDVITAERPDQFDPLAAAKRDLELDQTGLRSWPRDADGLMVVAEDLRLLGRGEQAAKMLEAALATPGPIAGATGEDKRNWVMDARSFALFETGRIDEAIAVMREAATLTEGSNGNVSQTINLAGLLNAAGRHEDAIATLRPFDEGRTASPYGDMWVATERACALIAARRPAEAAPYLEFTREHARDNQTARVKALLCDGQLDSVAAFYRERLQDPRDRRGALLELSHFKHGALPAFDALLAERLDAVRARSDVREAVAEVGRTADFDLNGGALIDVY